MFPKLYPCSKVLGLLNRIKNLQECYRILKKGGYLAISDWRKEQSEKGPSFELRYDPITVMAQLLSAGFNMIFNSGDYPDNFIIIAVKS